MACTIWDNIGQQTLFQSFIRPRHRGAGRNDWLISRAVKKENKLVHYHITSCILSEQVSHSNRLIMTLFCPCAAQICVFI